MKTWLKFSIGPILLVIILAIYLHGQLNSQHYFSSNNISILTTPDGIEDEQEKLGNSQVEVDLLADDTELQKGFNVLILGIDAWEGERSRTDLIMLANVNTVSKQINLVSIPRDTRVELPGIGYTKINHAHSIGEGQGGNNSGTMASLQAVSNLLNTEINYYIKVSFEGLKNFVDLIGGVELELSQPIYLSFVDITLPAEKQLVDGELVIEFVRERYSLPRGDFDRQKNNYLLLKALASRLLEPNSIKKAPLLIKQAKEDVVDTNFTDLELIRLALMFQGLADNNLNYIQIEGRSDYLFDPLVKSKIYYWIPDIEEVSKVSEKYFKN